VGIRLSEVVVTSRLVLLRGHVWLRLGEDGGVQFGVTPTRSL
jgi:hypothetical protein